MAGSTGLNSFADLQARSKALGQMPAQLAAAQQQNASYQSQLAALQNSLSGANAYRPSYTQGISQPVSYAPQTLTQNWSPNQANDALSRMASSNQMPYNPSSSPWYRRMATGGIADLVNRQ